MKVLAWLKKWREQNVRLHRLAADLATGSALSSDGVPSDLMQTVFMVMFFMTKEQLQETIQQLGKNGMLIGTKYMGSGVNGYPICTGLEILSTKEAAVVRRRWRKLHRSLYKGGKP